MKQIDGGVCAVEGVSAYGVRKGRDGLAIIQAEGAAAAVFTKNEIQAAPIQVTREYISGGRLYAIVANSGCANTMTGKKGVADARRMAELTSKALGVPKKSVGVASTGVIGRRLDMDLIGGQIKYVSGKLACSPKASMAAAKAIMTTDTRPKQFAIEVDGVRIGGMVKGSGMIHPNMATMLAFIFTDVRIAPSSLDRCLRRSVNKSFNMISVDGDTSTNDTAIIIATGKRGGMKTSIFQEALDTVCMRLARMIVEDGEGATRLMDCTVTGAQTMADARSAARSIVTSPLVKTALAGGDPNWGRIIAALGNSNASVDMERISLDIMDKGRSIRLVDKGEIKWSDAVRKVASKIMSSDYINIIVDLNLGDKRATSMGCDLTCEYVKINSEYTS